MTSDVVDVCFARGNNERGERMEVGPSLWDNRLSTTAANGSRVPVRVERSDQVTRAKVGVDGHASTPGPGAEPGKAGLDSGWELVISGIYRGDPAIEMSSPPSPPT